jgi:type IV secretory pathway TraG/TraD family ATPase VirD4
MRLDANLEILLRQGAAPIAARKVRYFAGGEFADILSVDMPPSRFEPH